MLALSCPRRLLCSETTKEDDAPATLDVKRCGVIRPGYFSGDGLELDSGLKTGAPSGSASPAGVAYMFGLER